MGYRVGFLAVVMLVLLRIAIGWHFLYEGMWKHENASFSAEGFFKQARGPWAEKFHNLIPDYDGRERLDPQRMAEKWDDYRRRLAEHYNFSQEQSDEAGQIYDRYVKQLQSYLDELDEITPDKERIDAEKEYFQKLDALTAAKGEDPTANSVPFQQKRYHDAETKLRKQAAPWLAEVDRLDKDYKTTLASLVDKDQKDRQAPFEAPPTQLDKIDKWTGCALMAIGAALILGLFTRIASVAGALFLASVVLAQPAWPGLYPPLPPSAGHSLVVTKEFIEMLAMLALAATPVGRWAGLDFFIHSIFVRPFFKGKEERHASHR